MKIINIKSPKISKSRESIDAISNVLVPQADVHPLFFLHPQLHAYDCADPPLCAVHPVICSYVQGVCEKFEIFKGATYLRRGSRLCIDSVRARTASCVRMGFELMEFELMAFE